MQMSGAHVVLECLRQEGVRHIFGYPGGVLLPFYDALYDCEDIEHILVRHEQGAAHMADGYARVTGKVGVCLATSGPGATNLVTGIANAYMDSIPMVAITGQVRTGVIGKDAFQEADITGITMPITKHNYLVKDPHDLPRVISEAFHIARTGRPGPVLIDIPFDVNKISIEWDKNLYPKKVQIPSYRPTTRGHEMQIRKAALAIGEAERPVLYIGGGAISANASKELTELAERTNILVTTTLLGKGIIDETHRLSIGMLGMHGTAYANHAVNNCDLLIAVGARFDDRVTGKVDKFAKSAKVIHIDIDPAEIGKVRIPDIPIVGDVKLVLKELLKHVEPRNWSKWNDQIMEWKRLFPLLYPQDGKLYTEYIIEQIGKATNWEAIMATDVGQHQMWAAQYYKCRRPRQWISSGGLGTMGFGLPAAIGAQMAFPDATVVCMTGDGSFQMCTQELMTAVVFGLPVITVISNNHTLGMVRQWQEMFYKERYSHTSLEASPDFVKLIEAYGGTGFRVEKPEEFMPAMQQAMTIRDKPTIIECMVPTYENVYPMIPAGESVSEMMIRDNLEDLKAGIASDSESWSFSDQDTVLAQYAEVVESVRNEETEG